MHRGIKNFARPCGGAEANTTQAHTRASTRGKTHDSKAKAVTMTRFVIGMLGAGQAVSKLSASDELP
jgi:hypothetical protein